jgi:hypothetical protein
MVDMPTGIEILKELYRVQFLGSAVEEVTLHSLQIFAVHRDDWELSKRSLANPK